jgi:hypothetical protein
VTVLSTRQTGETLLDETLKMMKQTEDSGERMGVATWVNLLSDKCRVPTVIFPPFPPCHSSFHAIHPSYPSLFLFFAVPGATAPRVSLPAPFLAARISLRAHRSYITTPSESLAGVAGRRGADSRRFAGRLAGSAYCATGPRRRARGVRSGSALWLHAWRPHAELGARGASTPMLVSSRFVPPFCPLFLFFRTVLRRRIPIYVCIARRPRRRAMRRHHRLLASGVRALARGRAP